MTEALIKAIDKHKREKEVDLTNLIDYVIKLVDCFEKEIEKYYNNEASIIEKIIIENKITIRFNQNIYDNIINYKLTGINDIDKDSLIVLRKNVLDCLRIINISKSFILDEFLKQLEKRDYKTPRVLVYNDNNKFYDIVFER